MDWQGQGRKKKEGRSYSIIQWRLHRARDTLTYNKKTTCHASDSHKGNRIDTLKTCLIRQQGRRHPPQCVLLTQISSHFLSPMHPIHQSPYTFFSVLELTTPISLKTHRPIYRYLLFSIRKWINSHCRLHLRISYEFRSYVCACMSVCVKPYKKFLTFAPVPNEKKKRKKKWNWRCVCCV